MLDVRDFGAKGDGIVDDTLAIQTAINSGNDILIPYGVYLITKNLLLKSNLTICGEGTLKVNREATVGNPVNVTVFSTDSAGPAVENIRLSGFTIDGGGQTGGNVEAGFKGAFGIYLSNASNVIIDSICIRNCGKINSADPQIDAGYSGFGIFAECRHGPISNIKILNSTIHNIAGGGINAGDGIAIAGYNPNTAIMPDDILIANCSINTIGRNAISLAGDFPESFCKNVRVINNYIAHTQLAGIDIEEGSDIILTANQYINCGNISHYYSYPVIFPTSYRLRTAIATGISSNNITISDSIIQNCNIGIAYGPLLNKILNVHISSSGFRDITRGLADSGDLIISDSHFMSVKPCFEYYSIHVNKVKLSKCFFAGSFIIQELHSANIDNCTFNADSTNPAVVFSNASSENILFNECNFLGNGNGVGIDISGGTFFSIKDCAISQCRFEDLDTGILADYRNILYWNVTNCIFSNIVTYCIRHDNADGLVAFKAIVGNKFINSNSADGININQSNPEILINQNYFYNINNCIKITGIFAPGIADIIISHNLAISCTNGIQILLNTPGSGTWDRCIVTYNNMHGCTGIKTSFISGGNANGYVSNNIV